MLRSSRLRQRAAVVQTPLFAAPGARVRMGGHLTTTGLPISATLLSTAKELASVGEAQAASLPHLQETPAMDVQELPL